MEQRALPPGAHPRPDDHGALIRARWILALLMLALGIAYVLHAVAFRPAEDRGTIAVVRTWEDLQSGPVLTLRDGATRVQVGIESRRIPEHGGALLYVLVQRESPAVGPPRATDAVPVGPVFVTMEPNADERGAPRIPVVSFPAPEDILYTHVVAPIAERTVVRVWDGPPAPPRSTTDVAAVVIAETTIRRVASDTSPWVALRADGPGHAEPLVNVCGPAALPYHPGSFPAAGSSVAMRVPLPRLVPEPDPAFRVAATQDGLAFTTDEGDPRFRFEFRNARPVEVLLARFTVNGRSVRPRDRAPRPWRSSIEDRRPGFDPGAAAFDWGFLALGAEPGDEVTVEFLWCGNGWAEPGRLRPWNTPAIGRPAFPVVRRTNPVSVVVPER